MTKKTSHTLFLLLLFLTAATATAIEPPKQVDPPKQAGSSKQATPRRKSKSAPTPFRFSETFDDFDPARFQTRIPNKNTQVRNGVLWTRGKSGGKYPPMVYLGVQGKDIEISFRYRHLENGGMVWFFVDGDDGFGSVDHMLRVKLNRTNVQLQIDAHSLNPNHPDRQNKRRPADKVSGAYRLNKKLSPEAVDLSANVWRRVRLVFKGDTVAVSVDGKSWSKTLKHTCFNATKRKLLWMQKGGAKGIEIDNIKVTEAASAVPPRNKDTSMPPRLIPALLMLAPLAPTFAQESDGAANNEARRTLERAIRAAGGQRALNRLKGPMMRMDRGKLYGMGQSIPFIAQYATKWPDWFRQEIEGAYTLTVNGDKAWVTGGGGFLQKLGGDQLEEQLRQVRTSWAEQLFPLTEKSYKLSPLKGIQVNGRATVGIKARREKGRDVKFFFDKQTYLLVKVETRVISPQHGPKPVLSETYFSNHRSVGGARVPAKAKIYFDKKLYSESEMVDYKMGATLDPEQFKQPK